MGKVPRDDSEARMGWLVIIGSIPIVVLGLFFQDAIDTSLRNLWITAAMLGGLRPGHRYRRPLRPQRAAAGVPDLAARHPASASPSRWP